MSETSEIYASLTKHPRGSLSELWGISAPLMLTSMSGTLMFFLDRIILAHYTTVAMNAAAVAGIVVAIFQFGSMGIAAIAEVFVGQYNGAKRYHEIGRPVWQMLWFSLATFLLFVPVAWFCAEYFIPEQYHADGIPYFRWIMEFGALMPIISALASFSVGRGKIKLVLFTTIGSNIVNLILDIVLVFGIEGLVPRMGAEGAAIATVVSQIFNVLLLFGLFLRKTNREKYGTGEYTFQPKLFWQCLRIGLPNSISHVIEITAISLTFHWMAAQSFAHMTTIAIGQSIFVLLSFVTDGLHRGIIAVVSNFIGANDWNKISKVLRSALRLELYFIGALAIPLVLFPDPLIKLFLAKQLSTEASTLLLHYAETACFWLWMFLCLDMVNWILIGILTAAGDTRFVMFMTAFNMWAFYLVPVYIFVVKWNGPPPRIYQLLIILGFISMVCLYWRYRSDRWRRMNVIPNGE